MPPRKKSAASKGPASIADDLPLENKQEAMATIIERLENLKDKSGHSVSMLFLELPSQEDYPDYYQIIQTPIAFDVIRSRLDAGLYTEETIGDFERDLKTMITNAKTFNVEKSQVYKDAVFLEFSADFCRRIVDVIKDLEDKEGRQLAELFLELPSAKEYPDYYDEITKPIAIGDIEEKIDQGEYLTLESFEKDMNQMFDNAKQYNAEGSDVYHDAEELQQLFWRSIGKNGRGRQSKKKVPKRHENELREVYHNGDVFKAGDFVHIRNDSDPSKPIIGLIFGLWIDAKGAKRVDAGWFLRPEQIVVPYASRFYPSEVVKMSERVDYFLDDVQGRCYVLQTKDYVRGRPLSWKEGQAIYVCEQRYNESYKSVAKIKNWATCLVPGQKHNDPLLTLFPYPLVLKKLPSASMLNKAGKRDTSEPVSRANTPQGSAYTAGTEESDPEGTEESEEPSFSVSSSMSPEASTKRKPKAAPKKTKVKATPLTTPKSTPAPKATTANKRKSSQIQPEALVAQPTKTAKIVKKTKSSEQEFQEPEQLAPERPLAQTTFHCVYSYPGTKAVCSEKFTDEAELARHVSEKHVHSAPRASQVDTTPTNGSRVQKISAGQSVEPSSPSTPTPVQTAPPPPTIMGQAQNAYHNSQYGTANQYSAAPGPRPTVPSQQMYSTAGYQQQPTQQTMQYMQPSHQRGLSYPQDYSQQTMHAGATRPQGYAQNTSYNQAYGQTYGMQQQQQAGYNSYGQPQFQQGYSTTGYPMHQQNPYAQQHPVSQQPYHHTTQQQQQHYSQPYSTPAAQTAPHRHLPTPVPSQTHPSNPQDFTQQQRMVQQQQQFAQQQQYLAQQQQQQQQFVPQTTGGYHQRSLSHQTQTTTPQQQQPYQPPSPLTVVASQPYAAMNPAPYQQQAYMPPSSVAYSTSGHGASLSNASSHGSTATLTTAMEGVGLGLSGVTNVEHGRITAPTASTVIANGASGYMNGSNLQT
ncbi:hypothetical protein EC991_004312 [Linnemannia zychae]|nr:hypothetical protein EC991_004312 [Linnemannia zychae]